MDTQTALFKELIRCISRLSEITPDDFFWDNFHAYVYQLTEEVLKNRYLEHYQVISDNPKCLPKPGRVFFIPEATFPDRESIQQKFDLTELIDLEDRHWNNFDTKSYYSKDGKLVRIIKISSRHVERIYGISNLSKHYLTYAVQDTLQSP